MARARGAVGPFPDGVDPQAYERLRRRVLWTMPSGLYVVGSRAGDRRNLMTANWATQLASEPKLLGVSVEREALTHELISAGGAFSLCIIARRDRAIVRRFVKPVEHDKASGTLNGFSFHDGRTGAPLLDAAIAGLECQVRERVILGSHTLFVGEVVDAVFQDDETTPPLRMEDTRMSYGG